MDAVTYPDQEVVDHMSEHFVCFKPKLADHKELAKRFGVVWTPGLVWLDDSGEAHHENVGYFEPAELLAEATFGRGKVAIGRHDWEAASECFGELVEKWPDSHAAAASLYWHGVTSYLASEDKERLTSSWNRLLDEHPDSAWAMKVSFLRKS